MEEPLAKKSRKSSAEDASGKKSRKKHPEHNPGTEPEQIIKSTEADTENIVDFMHEEIKKRPMNRKKLMQRARETMAVAVLFGVVSCIVFAILLPIINNIVNPGEKETMTVTLPETSESEELTPEEMLENERKREATKEKARIEDELDSLLDEKIIGVEQQKRISASLQQLAADSSGMIAAVSGITSDTDWFNDSYENKDTVSGLVTKKNRGFGPHDGDHRAFCTNECHSGGAAGRNQRGCSGIISRIDHNRCPGDRHWQSHRNLRVCHIRKCDGSGREPGDTGQQSVLPYD